MAVVDKFLKGAKPAEQPTRFELSTVGD